MHKIGKLQICCVPFLALRYDPNQEQNKNKNDRPALD